MRHPTTLPTPQQQHLAKVLRRHGIAPVARIMGVDREALAKLAAGIPARAGSVALALAALPTLDAAIDTGELPPRAA